MDKKTPVEIADALIKFIEEFGASSIEDATHEEIFTAYKVRRDDKHRYYDKRIQRFLEDLEEF